MDNNLQQRADNGLSHTTTAADGGGADIKSNCNINEGTSSRKNSNDGASNEDVVLPPEGMLLCLVYVCLYIFT